jgi:hypothetical protein
MTFAQFAAYTKHLLSFHSFLKYGGRLLSEEMEEEQSRRRKENMSQQLHL